MNVDGGYVGVWGVCGGCVGGLDVHCVCGIHVIQMRTLILQRFDNLHFGSKHFCV